MHRLDVALSNSFPIAQVPRYGALERLANNGQRLLVGGNGIFLEVRRDWLYAIQQCALVAQHVRLPFGLVEPTIELAFGAAPEPLIEDFIDQAREVAPLETAGAIVYHARTGRLSLRPCEIQSATRASVVYRPPTLGVGESLVIDIHSHGDLAAGFSAQDDDDDKSATKVAIVVGNVRAESPQIRARLCLNGLFLPAAYPALSTTTDELGDLDCQYLDAILFGTTTKDATP